MAEPTKQERAARINDVRDAYDVARGFEDEDFLTDLLTDLMHYCEIQGMDFGRALVAAEVSFEEEG